MINPQNRFSSKVTSITILVLKYDTADLFLKGPLPSPFTLE